MQRFSLWAFALVYFFLLGIGLAQELPTENPREVWVKGRQVRHSWKAGRIFIDTLDAQTLLQVNSEYRQVDLIKALEERGDYVWTVTDDKFEATRDSSKYSVNTNPTQASRSNAQSAATANARLQQKQTEEMEPYLVYHVQRFTADTGYVRAYITIGNEGGSPSDPSTVLCQFQDGFGKTYAEHKSVVPSLQPGERYQIEAFSMVEVEETSITPTTDNVAVNFFSDGKGPTSINEARKEARARKRSRL